MNMPYIGGAAATTVPVSLAPLLRKAEHAYLEEGRGGPPAAGREGGSAAPAAAEPASPKTWAGATSHVSSQPYPTETHLRSWEEGGERMRRLSDSNVVRN